MNVYFPRLLTLNQKIMTPNNLITYVMDSGNLWKRIVAGAAIGFIFMGVFLMGAEGEPAWGEYWKVRPMIVAPIAGAMGGVFFFLMEYVGREGGWKKVFCYLVGVMGFIIALWMGIVLGLDGTLWD